MVKRPPTRSCHGLDLLIPKPVPKTTRRSGDRAYSVAAANVVEQASFIPRLTKLIFCNTSITKGGGVLQPLPRFSKPKPPMKLILVSIGRYGPSLSIHTKMSTIDQGVIVMTL